MSILKKILKKILKFIPDERSSLEDIKKELVYIPKNYLRMSN